MLAGSWYHHGAGEEENSNEASCVVALHLDAETSLAPVPSLSVVTDGVVRSEANPLGNGAVLLLRLGELLLRAERLVARHFD